MKTQPSKSTEDIEKVITDYGDMLFRLCFVMLKNNADAEDAVQETVIRYMQKAPEFVDSEHEKAWLITTAKNKCADLFRFRRRHPQDNIDYLQELPYEITDSGILDALMSLPEKYRLVLTLYYVEGYNTSEIAEIIKKSTSAVKMRMQKGRKLLKEIYGKECI